jgi:hypothetical protein
MVVGCWRTIAATFLARQQLLICEHEQTLSVDDVIMSFAYDSRRGSWRQRGSANLGPQDPRLRGNRVQSHRAVRDAVPLPHRAGQAGEAAGQPERDRAAAPVAKKNGASLDFRGAALVELGRKVDEARAALEPAQAAYEEACRAVAGSGRTAARC